MKRKKIKKNVKIIFILLLSNVFSFMLLQQKTQNMNYYQKKESQKITELKKDNKKLKEQIESLRNPQESYAEDVNKKLKKSNYPAYLSLQTDERWCNQQYGWGPVPTILVNGCSIVGLAINQSIIEKKQISPLNILEWSGDTYFTNSGTDWSIFKDFAQHYNYHYVDLGDDINNVLPFLKKDYSVIAAAHPGIFTSIGHTLVLTHYDKNGIRLLDPSDNNQKNHSLQYYSPEQIQNEISHFWIISKKKI